MSYAYRQRKKAIKRWKRDNPGKLEWGSITALDFGFLQAEWNRVITATPLGTLEQFMEARR